MAALVTISAAYGSGGSLVGPRLASRLEVPFLDRAIPVSVADHLEVPRQGLIKQQVPRDLFRRWVPRFAPATHRFAGTATRNDPTHMSEEEFRRETEQVLHEYSDSGAVILGRAAAVVLRDEPGALHVRLDGPADRRIGQAMIVLGVDRPTAERELKIADRARETYVQRWYGVDPHDPRIYDLVIDSTRLRVDACVDLIEFAVRHARRARADSQPSPALQA
ncbi:MAG TPA: cytidylate kinase-like family protein [Solirubrobacteraceae bacterium]|jgi:cytidylate kinase|nr:cytidylate kinase-like family protein [Solirubrobacteraceae bacterium]